MTTLNKEQNNRICRVESAGGLDNSVRRLIQNPHKILKPFIREGMAVLDLGCGPGFFSIEIAKMLFASGKVIAADVQDGMLEMVTKKIKGTELEQRIVIHKTQEDSIGLAENVDFVFAFYMIHEAPNQVKLFEELKSILKSDGKIYIVEPKFHVPKKMFEAMIDRIKGVGFEVVEGPKIFLSRTIILTNMKPNHLFFPV